MENRKRFLFVYPRIPDTYWSYRYALRFVGKRALMPPLGLATVAAMVPAQYVCRIIDMNVEPLHDADIRESDLVLISAMIVQKETMARVVERCRRIGVPVAAGGPYPSSSHVDIHGVDHFILGEAEQSFPAFLADYAAGCPKPCYPAGTRPTLDATPVPRFDLLDMDKYDTLPIQFSRGCPYDCEFCDIVQLFGRKVRSKAPARFIEELNAGYAGGFRGSVFVVDDNFIGNHSRTKALLREVAKWQRDHDYPFKLCTEASIDLARDPELLDLMVEAGFTMAFVGLESPVDDSLESAGKRQNVGTTIQRDVRAIQERGIEVTGGFIIGFDSDPPDIFDRQIRFIQQLAIPTAMIGLLMALPGTRLHQRLSAEKRLLSDSNGDNLSSAAMNFRPVLPAGLIAEGYRRVLTTVYSPGRYFRRCLALLKRYPQNHRQSSTAMAIGKREVLGCLHSVTKQSMTRYGLSYLSYLVRAILRHPDQLVRIFTMAIQGHHYMTVTRRLFPERTADLTGATFGAFEPSRISGTMS